MWEDSQNKRGGRWLVNLDRRKRGAELDSFWLETVCLLLLVQRIYRLLTVAELLQRL